VSGVTDAGVPLEALDWRSSDQCVQVRSILVQNESLKVEPPRFTGVFSLHLFWPVGYQ